MATTAAVARNLLKNSNSLPQIIRGQILGRSNVFGNLNNIAKNHQVVQYLIVSNQNIHPQMPIFNFGEMCSLPGSSGRLSLEEEEFGHGPILEARAKRFVEEDDDDGSDFDDDDDIDDTYCNYREDGDEYSDDDGEEGDDDFEEKFKRF